VLRIFGPKIDKMTGDWRQLHIEDLHTSCSSPSMIRMTKSRRIRWAGHVARMGPKKNAYRIFVRKPDGKRRLGRPRHRWVDNIKMDLRETTLLPSVSRLSRTVWSNPQAACGPLIHFVGTCPSYWIKNIN
jgi:hypothetical protein